MRSKESCMAYGSLGILLPLALFLYVARAAHAGPIPQSVLADTTHATDCINGGVLGKQNQKCTDLDDGKLWICKTPSAGGSSSAFCDAPGDWQAAGFSLVDGSGLINFNSANGASQTLGGTAPVAVSTNTGTNTTTVSISDGNKGDISTIGGTWTVDSGAVLAAEVPNTPAGILAPTGVQPALNELDSEKQPLDADLTNLASKTVAGTSGTIRLSSGNF